MWVWSLSVNYFSFAKGFKERERERERERFCTWEGETMAETIRCFICLGIYW